MPRFARCVFAVFLAVCCLTSNLACQAAAPETAAAAFILMEAGSGRVLAARNETQERSIASTTKIMTCLVALEHSELTEKVTVNRARKIQRFLAQPTFVAEKFTGLPGVYVPLEETLRGFEAILSGEMDGYPEMAFYNVGTLDDALAKAKKMESGEA